MKNLKKLTAVLLTVAMITAMALVPAFAEGTSTISADATTCQTLKVLQGENGVTADYLAKPTLRYQLAIILLRLLDKEDDALAGTYTTNFADAKDVNADNQKILGFLKAHPEFGWEGDTVTGKFDPLGKVTPQMFDKVLLYTLGYSEGAGKDFLYANAVSFAGTAGLSKLAAKTELTNDDLATGLVEALKANIKGGSKTFAASLIEDTKTSLFTAAQAETAGLYSIKTTATVTAAKANTLKVTFNKAVDTTKAVFAVKTGSSSVTVATPVWNDAKTEATLVKTASSFIAGDYTVTVTGLGDTITGTVTIADQKVAKIEFVGNDIIKAADGLSATFKYVVKDQYGENYTKYASLSHNESVGAGNTLDPITGVGTVNYNFAGDVVTKTVVVVLVDPATGVNATATLNIASSAKVTSVTFGDVKLPTGLTRLQKSATLSTMPVTVIDQYGNKITNLATLNSSITLLSSANGIVSFAFANDAAGNAIINIDTSALDIARTVLLTAVVNADGTTYSKSFDVALAAAPKSVSFGDINQEVIANGDANVVMDITVVDQFGTELTKAQIAANAVAIQNMISAPSNIGSNAIVTDPNSSNYGKYKFNATAEGTGMFVTSSVTAGVKTKTIVVKPARVLTDVVAPADVNLMQGATADVKFKFFDQYGKQYISGTTNTVPNGALKYAVALTKVSGDDAAVTNGGGETFGQVIAAGQESDLNLLTVNAAANKTGTYKLTVYLMKAAAVTGTTTANLVPATIQSSAAINVNVVKNNVAGLTYSIADIPTLAGDQTYTADDAHAAAVEVIAKDASGTEYAVSAADILSVTSSKSTTVADIGVDADGVTKVFGLDVTGLATPAVNQTATVIVTVNTLDGLKVLTKDVTVSPAAPSTQEIRIVTAKLTNPTTYVPSSIVDKSYYALTTAGIAAGVDFFVIAKDQYGVWSDVDGTNVTIYVNSTDKAPYNKFSVTAAEKLVAANTTGITAGVDIKATAVVAGKIKDITLHLD